MPQSICAFSGAGELFMFVGAVRVKWSARFLALGKIANSFFGE
jgi:hypothetical protein